MADFKVKESDSLRRYRTEIPNIIFTLGLSPYELTLYAHLKRIAGPTGLCWKSTDTLAAECNMSKAQISRAKKELRRAREELNGKSLILIEEESSGGGRANHVVSITDIWPENFKYFERNEDLKFLPETSSKKYAKPI